MKSHPSKGGRPSKLTTETALSIVSALARGESFDAAARQGGIGPSSLYRWMVLGANGDSRYAPLVKAIHQARSIARSHGALKGLAWDMFRKGGF
jgi:hypothetical protein